MGCREPFDNLADTLSCGHARLPAEAFPIWTPKLNTGRPCAGTAERADDELENRRARQAPGVRSLSLRHRPFHCKDFVGHSGRRRTVAAIGLRCGLLVRCRQSSWGLAPPEVVRRRVGPVPPRDFVVDGLLTHRIDPSDHGVDEVSIGSS
jgi:hypothetical protein